MLTTQEAVKNITKHARRATAKQWRAGSSWYSDAHTFCDTLAKYERLPVHSVVGCLAALSPQCSWKDNLLGTLSMVKLRKVSPASPIYPVNATKAFDLAHCNADPDQVLGGLKVRAFYNNILAPSHSKQVTVDTHAARAAFGKHSLSAKEVSFVFRAKGNRIIQDAYRVVAKRYKVIPSKLQATVWLRVKADLERVPAVEQLGLYIK